MKINFKFNIGDKVQTEFNDHGMKKILTGTILKCSYFNNKKYYMASFSTDACKIIFLDEKKIITEGTCLNCKGHKCVLVNEKEINGINARYYMCKKCGSITRFIYGKYQNIKLVDYNRCYSEYI